MPHCFCTYARAHLSLNVHLVQGVRKIRITVCICTCARVRIGRTSAALLELNLLCMEGWFVFCPPGRVPCWCYNRTHVRRYCCCLPLEFVLLTFCLAACFSLSLLVSALARAGTVDCHGPYQVLCLLLEFLAQVAALSNVNEMTSEVLSQVIKSIDHPLYIARAVLFETWTYNSFTKFHEQSKLSAHAGEPMAVCTVHATGPSEYANALPKGG